MFSVVILTLNEEKNLSRCLASAAASPDVVVVDSGSTDRTADLAKSHGARVFVNRFENFGQQRNYAHVAVQFRYPWVFHLDADEQLTPELVEELKARGRENRGELDGFLVAPRMVFRGRWIPHCTDYPAYQTRFVHAQRFRFIQVGHGQREAPGMRLGKLKNNYVHDLSADGEESLVEKHRRYARAEARHHADSSGDSVSAAGLWSRDPLVRRRTLKALSKNLPARGPLRFVYQYILRGGLLDGAPGLAYCLLMARYEHWIGRELRELNRRGSDPNRP